MIYALIRAARGAATVISAGAAWTIAAVATPVIPCAGDTAPAAAIEAAEAHVLARWRLDGANVHAAFTTTLPPANPFDLTARQSATKAAVQPQGEGGPPDAPIKGHVWGQGLACHVEAVSPQGPYIVRYGTAIVAFHEGRDWSPPLRGGPIQVLGLTRQGETWRVLDRSAELTLLLPGAVLRKPTAEELPKPDRAGGIPCTGTRLWNGRACVAPTEIRPSRAALR